MEFEAKVVKITRHRRKGLNRSEKGNEFLREYNWRREKKVTFYSQLLLEHRLPPVLAVKLKSRKLLRHYVSMTF